jgi:IS30 family transposase
MSQEEFQYLDKAIREGLASKRSLYDIKKGDSSIKVSLGTIYRLIREGKLSSKRYDLPYAVTYKKRKVQNKKYEYSSNCEIDRTHHTFLDYLSCLRKSPNVFASQLDFLGSIKTDNSLIITLTIPRLHFVIIRKMKSPTSKDVVSFFDRLEENMTFEGYREVFPIILGDRDPRFADYKGIEFSKLDGAIRSNMFYCDAFRSNQKANVENMNKQLRKYFPKGLSIDSLTNEQVMAINEAINNSRVASLDGSSPKEAFIRVYGESLLLDIEKTK